MLPKRAPPLMRPVMKMVSNQVLDAMINPQLKLPAYLSLQVSGEIPRDLPIPIRSLAEKSGSAAAPRGVPVMHSTIPVYDDCVY